MHETRDALPTGIVAFLFSDVEASTRRWEQYGRGDARRAAPSRRDPAAGDRGARRLRFQNDRRRVLCRFFERFRCTRRRDRTRSGVSKARIFARLTACACAWRSMPARPTNEPATISEARSIAPRGSCPQRTAARSCSRPTPPNWHSKKLPDGITLRNLGTVPLRGIKEPERVYQAVGAGLRSESKPLRALETPPNNLPRQSTSFVGRHDDLARVEALLDEGSVVTIVGAGRHREDAPRARDCREPAQRRARRRVARRSRRRSAIPALIASTILSAVGAELTHG